MNTKSWYSAHAVFLETRLSAGDIWDLVARPKGVYSNELFCVLEEWSAYLKQERIDPVVYQQNPSIGDGSRIASS